MTRGSVGRRALLLQALAASACARCGAVPEAVVPLRSIEGFPVLTASVGGTPVSFVLDTGAQGHLVLPAAAAALGLPVLPGTAPLLGTGGAREAPLVLLAGVRLGSAVLDPAPAPEATLPALPQVTPPIVGLIGAPLLDRFDLALDAPAGQLALYPAGACGEVGATIPLRVTADRQLLLPVEIDGQRFTALLDTGSRATLLTVAAGARLGLRASASANTSRGVDGATLPVGHGRVARFAVGEDVRRDVPVSVAPVALGVADVLLGFDYLGQRLVWISAATARLAVAPAGPAPSAR